MKIDLTGKSWANKTSPEMTLEELGDAMDTYRSTGCQLDANVALGYEVEVLRRHGLPEDYGD
ncbi:hypothetical protein [Streptomyces benahoarensis]|uniref:Uncharacterized protein n=1 Tax=Streptomyces benahoarensis TaxID=2595054 RepID=A0A553XP09_9ACTN|nr:hypothetical protein [Streptomyces benahoarensis]TSB18084.1 hypothetical protein FNJ62_25220 [Streptomyces benahoarensis]TSB18513.1 hypothetical protein FNZ23_29675 [Streptomyces benahoarensis]